MIQVKEDILNLLIDIISEALLVDRNLIVAKDHKVGGEAGARKKEIVMARHAYSYIAMQLPWCTDTEAGLIINRDRTTVLHGKGVIEGVLFLSKMSGNILEKRLMKVIDSCIIRFKNESQKIDVMQFDLIKRVYEYKTKGKIYNRIGQL